MSLIRFNVFGRALAVRRDGDSWRVYSVGTDGKLGAAGLVIPDFIAENELERYLADILHENAPPDPRPDSSITLEATGSSDFERCECCGQHSRTVWGLAYRGGGAHAAYFVHWTLGRVADQGAHFDLVLGRWGAGTTKADRHAVSVEYRRTDRGPAFMVVDATARPIARHELVGLALRRSEVIGTAVATDAFELLDAIWLKDFRIAEVTGGDSVGHSTRE